METYNMKVFYYYNGTQYRLYTRPINRLSDSEKEARRKRMEQKQEYKKKYSLVENVCDSSLIYNPFEDCYMEYKDLDELLWFEKESHFINLRSQRVSLNRTKQNLIGICRANKWDYMVTFTFNPKKVDRKNYEEVCKKACKWLNNLKERQCFNMKYVLVPELHKDGESYHLHGLLSDCKGLQMHVSGKFDKSGRIIYNIPAWEYGWNTATEIGHSGKASNYISKYITKDTEHLLKGKRRYWASKNTILPKNVCDEVLVDDYMLALEMLSPYIKYIKNTKVPQCGRNVYYIEV